MAKINIKLDNKFFSELSGSLTKSHFDGNKKLLGIFNFINTDAQDDKIDIREIMGFAHNIMKADTNNDGEVDKKELEAYIKENENTFKPLKIKAKDIIEFFYVFHNKSDKTVKTETKADADNNRQIPDLIEQRDFAESERTAIIPLLNHYEPEYVNKIFSVEFPDNHGNREAGNLNRCLSGSELIMFFSLPEDKQQKVIDALEDGSINQCKYTITEILELLSVENSMGTDIIHSEDKLTFSYDSRTGIVTVTDKNNPKIQNSYKPDYQNGIYEQIINDKENNQIIITNYENHIRQTVNYTIPELSPVERMEYLSHPDKFRIYNNEIIEICDNDMNVLQTITRTDSDVAGVQNINVTNQGDISSAVIDNEGNTIISKNLTSPLGDKTNYYYKKSQDGSFAECSYRITDSNGNVLYEREQNISKISDTEYIHIINGTEYLVTFEQNSVSIKRSVDNQTVTIDLANLIDEEGRDSILEIIKTFPADRLWAIQRIPLDSIHYDADDSEMHGNNGQFYGEQRTILVGKQYAGNYQINTILATLIHEFGHYLDSDIETGETGIIGYNEAVINTFNTEYAEFLRHSTSLQQEYVKYFTTNNRGATERVAETNLLVTAYQSDTKASRALYYQQFFPRTIACIANLIDTRISDNNQAENYIAQQNH